MWMIWKIGTCETCDPPVKKMQICRIVKFTMCLCCRLRDHYWFYKHAPRKSLCWPQQHAERGGETRHLLRLAAEGELRLHPREDGSRRVLQLRGRHGVRPGQLLPLSQGLDMYSLLIVTGIGLDAVWNTFSNMCHHIHKSNIVWKHLHWSVSPVFRSESMIDIQVFFAPWESLNLTDLLVVKSGNVL